MRYLKSFINDAAIQEAIDNKSLGKPYVALNESAGTIDWNGKTPTPEGYYVIDNHGNFYQLQEGGTESDIATGSFTKPAGVGISLYHDGVLVNLTHGNVIITKMCNEDVLDSWWEYTTFGQPIENYCSQKELEFFNSGTLDSDEVSVEIRLYNNSSGGIDANIAFYLQSCEE